MKINMATSLFAIGLLAAIGLAQGAGRFSYSADGSEVTDSSTGLTWKRCPEGMTWNNTACTSSASTYTHERALQHAQTQTGWRLPNIKELASIVDDTTSGPAIDAAAFPNTPTGYFWSSSPYAANSDNAWSIDFNYGSVGADNSRTGNYKVRLVK